MNKEVLLSVENLTIGFYMDNKLNKSKEFIPVVEKSSFSIEAGEILGIVGESGSGKTMTVLAIMDLLPETAVIIDGKITYMTNDLTNATKKQLREIKGNEIAMIFQEPMTSFNPVMTIGQQVEEMLKLHVKLDAEEYRKRTIAALIEVELEDVEAIYHKYPHELSGGMRQRAMIAMAMIAGPKLLIADEPTTALDVTIQYKILKLLKKLSHIHGTSIILVSHDLGVIKSICSRALVMRNGKIVESGKASELFLHPQTEYTKELVAAAPATWMKQQNMQINNRLKNSLNELQKADKGNGTEESNIRNIAIQKDTDTDTDIDTDIDIDIDIDIDKDNDSDKDKIKEYILQVDGLNVYYEERSKHIFGKRLRRQVVKNASLSIMKGEALGIVGESGCGKTSLAKAIAGLITETDGVITLSVTSGAEGHQVTSRPQMVFQDPYGSLNPARKIGWILEEPLRIKSGFSREERKKRVREVVLQVGLEEEHLNRYVSQLSGGQKQRVAIAVTLMLNPSLIIFDEPVSSLDVTVQAQILDLLKELQYKYKLSYLFISHDLNVIYQVCNRVCVMYKGEIIETRKTSELFLNPIEEYSKVLLAASISE
ncbi:MAG TPA: ABC transporter ATP-binding protein [Mobilitalea sp.]|nr:ABC transporter ATP-binding protein [Mobilitalea sp.]